MLLQQKHIQFRMEDLDTLPTIAGDPKRLYSLLYNLTHNAIPEVPPNGSITIRGQHTAGAETILLTVEDTGNGMPEEVRARLFTGRTASRKAGGTGLGMKIVKDVVDAHEGKIEVQSREGRGTTFLITLPVRPRGSAGHTHTRPASKPRSGERSLSDYV